MRDKGIYLVLVATLLVSSGLAFPPASAGGCTDDDTGGGTGGNTASCDYSCTSDQWLKIRVTTHDGTWPYADASGSTSCGDQAASCPRTTKECSGQSPGKTTSGGSGTCTGRSHETWNSGVTVTCSSWADSPTEPGCLFNCNGGGPVETGGGGTGGGGTVGTKSVPILPVPSVPEPGDVPVETRGASAATWLFIHKGEATAYALAGGSWVPIPSACFPLADGGVECRAGLYANVK